MNLIKKYYKNRLPGVWGFVYVDCLYLEFGNNFMKL